MEVVSVEADAIHIRAVRAGETTLAVIAKVAWGRGEPKERDDKLTIRVTDPPDPSELIGLWIEEDSGWVLWLDVREDGTFVADCASSRPTFEDARSGTWTLNEHDLTFEPIDADPRLGQVAVDESGILLTHARLCDWSGDDVRMTRVAP